MRKCKFRLTVPSVVVGLLFSSSAIAGDVVVQPGDTLWSIAKNSRAHESVAIHDQVDAIFRLNPHAFAGDSVDSLRYGAVLTLPEDGQDESNLSVPKRSLDSAKQHRTVIVIRGVEEELMEVRSSL
jgi:FimV-like protein